MSPKVLRTVQFCQFYRECPICWLKPQLLESSASMWIWILTWKEKQISNSEVQRKSLGKCETREPSKLEITMSNKVAYFKICLNAAERAWAWVSGDDNTVQTLWTSLLGAAAQDIRKDSNTPKLYGLALLLLPSAISERLRARGWKTILHYFGEEGGGEGILTNPIYFHR